MNSFQSGIKSIRWGKVTKFAVKGLIAFIIAFGLSIPIAGGVAVATFLGLPLPGSELPEEPRSLVAEPSIVLDANGDEIALFRDFDQTVEIEPEDIPQHLKDAFVAIEDRRFWEHSGVDLEGIARAARENVSAGYVKEGGSTITQQYIKNAYLNNAKSFERKIDEALLAVELEKELSKEEILFNYVNISFFGSGAYGVGAASEIYFSKHVSEINISEAATLAGLVKAPTAFSPHSNPEAADERRRLVINAMLEEGYITEAEAAEATAAEVKRFSDGDFTLPATFVFDRPSKGSDEFPFFSDWIEQTLVDELGPDQVYRGGLTIQTTLDPELQNAAREAADARLETTEHPVDLSIVSVEPDTGFVRAILGGRDYETSQVNLGLGGTSGFQPGSTFKPFVLATAFEQGIGPEVIYDAPATWPVPGCVGDECSISNFGVNGFGEITLREAMRASVNTVFAQLVVDVTIGETVELSQNFGLSRVSDDVAYGPSFALGAAEASPLEMASAYATFANSGIYQEPTAILTVTDSDENVIIDNRLRQGERVISAATADNVTDVLAGVIDGGTGARASIGRPAAGKTGTAQAFRAAWFVGYTPQLATAVWMGHSDGLRSLENINGVRNVTGGSHPATAWRDFNLAAHEGLDVIEFPEPDQIVSLDFVEPQLDENGELIEVPVQRVTKQAVREFTEIGAQQARSSLARNCGERDCVEREVDLPNLPASVPPTTIPPTTVAPVGNDQSSSINQERDNE